MNIRVPFVEIQDSVLAELQRKAAAYDDLVAAQGDAVGEVVIEAMGIGDAQMVRFHMYKEIPPFGTKLYTAPHSVQKLQKEVERLRGLKFSDRNYSAIKSRMEIAEAEVERLTKQLAQPSWNVGDVESLTRYGWIGDSIGVGSTLEFGETEDGTYVRLADVRAILSAPVVKAEQLAAGQVPDGYALIEKHWESNIWYAAEMLSKSDSVIDRNEGAALHKLYYLLTSAPVPSTVGQRVPDELINALREIKPGRVGASGFINPAYIEGYNYCAKHVQELLDEHVATQPVQIAYPQSEAQVKKASLYSVGLNAGWEDGMYEASKMAVEMGGSKIAQAIRKEIELSKQFTAPPQAAPEQEGQL